MEIVLILPLDWAHLEHVTPQFSLRKQNVLGLVGTGVGTWGVVEAWHLHDVGIELIYTMHKLMHANMLGFLSTLVR
jgi:hypothetical protein